MTIEKTIKHCEKACSNTECANEYKQVAGLDEIAISGVRDHVEKLGTVTVAGPFGESPRDVPIKNFVRCEFTGRRLCTVAETTENTFVLAVENPASSGRASSSVMHLTEESLFALVSSVFVYFTHMGVDVDEKLKNINITGGGNISFEYAEGD